MKDKNSVAVKEIFGSRGRGGCIVEVKKTITGEQLRNRLVNYKEHIPFISHDIYPAIVNEGTYRTGKQAIEIYNGDVYSSEFYFENYEK